jgi:hypothetical protein
MEKKRRVTTCSFCGWSSDESGAHVEGPADVYLCERCCGIALGIFRHERAVREGRAEPVGTEEGGAAMGTVHFLRKAAR